MMNNIKNPLLFLAPMAGFTDAPFREICRNHGADITVTEMISAKAMTFKDLKTAELANLPEGDKPTSIQIFGHEPKVMGEAAKMLVSETYAGCKSIEKPYSIDINMGCPVKKIFNSGDGSSLMKDAGLCGEIVASVVEATKEYNIPVSVKMRLGWDDNNIYVKDVASQCAKNGAKIITIHCRTKEEMYREGIHPEYISEIKDILANDVYLVGNGDITDAESAMKLLSYGCDGLMIGRAALGNPWIFEEIKAKLNNESFLAPSSEDKIKEAINLVRKVVELKGESRGIPESRGRAAHFIKGMDNSAKGRDRLNHTNTLEEFENEILRLI